MGARRRARRPGGARRRRWRALDVWCGVASRGSRRSCSACVCLQNGGWISVCEHYEETVAPRRTDRRCRGSRSSLRRVFCILPPLAKGGLKCSNFDLTSLNAIGWALQLQACCWVKLSCSCFLPGYGQFYRGEIKLHCSNHDYAVWYDRNIRPKWPPTTPTDLFNHICIMITSLYLQTSETKVKRV